MTALVTPGGAEPVPASQAAPGWGVWFEPLLPARELAHLAAVSEEAGAGYVFVADEGTDRDVYIVLTAIALATSRIRLVTGITNPFSRHPVATAAAFATLEELAPGRVIAGFGVGGGRVLGPLGLTPARPYTALRETVEIVDRLLAGEEVTRDGEVRVDRAVIPWAPGRLPIAIAGRGPRVEALGIEAADWVLLAGKPLGELPALLARIRAGRPDPATPPARVAWSTYVGWTDAMVEEIRPHFTYATVDMPPATRAALGVADSTTDRIREVMRRDGIEAAAHLVPDSVIAGSAVVGDPAAVVRRLAEVRETARPDLFVLALNGYADAERHITEAAPLIAAAGFISEEP
jgi:5,10-methylenetetrahydromethanopterin reductase